MELQEDVDPNVEPPGTGDFWVYILTNERRTVLYIGITNNLEMRLSQHAQKEGSDFTKRYQLSCLLFYESFPDPIQAIRREKQLKGWTRAKKVALISKVNPEFEDLGLTLRGIQGMSVGQEYNRNAIPRGPSTPLCSAQDDGVFQHDDHE